MESTTSTLKRALYILIVVIFAGGPAYTAVKQAWEAHKQKQELKPYAKDIKKCLAQKEQETAGQAVVGLEYSCAVEIAAGFYGVDPEKAIRLCMAYNPVKKDYYDPNDAFDRQELNTMNIACRVSIRRAISERESGPSANSQ